jgi:hypothetical protein
MKNNKWLNYSLGILLTLVVLTVVAGAGFRAGAMQSTSFAHPSFVNGFNGQVMQRDFHNNGARQMMGSLKNEGLENRSNNRGFDRRDGGFSLLAPIFGLIRFIVLGLLVWLGYKFVKNSGWRLTRVQATSPATPSNNEVSSVEVEEKKEAE